MTLADRLVLKPEFKARTNTAVTLDQAAERIETAFPGVEKRAPEDVPFILRKVEASVRKREWGDVTDGDVSVAIYAELEGKTKLSQELRKFIARELQATTNPTLLDVLCRGYLVSWVGGSTKTHSYSGLLAEKAPYLPIRWSSLFSKCPNFLDAEKGCDEVGEQMVGVASPYVWLKGLGLPAPHEQGFMLQAHHSFIRLTPAPKTEEAVDKLLSWVTQPNKTESLDTRAAGVVEKILSPWLSSDCPEHLRDYCVDRLVKRFGDPRKERKAFWSQIGEPHRRVMLKWLARKSMEAIFEIVTLAEKGTELGHHWAKRKPFWINIYDKGRIDEAWVALGKNAVPYAIELYARTDDPSFQSYGRLTGRNDTCLLFMKVGDTIIVEGSHSFRVHVFPTPSRVTPALYAGNYDINDIMLSVGHQDARMHDVAGNWMTWVQRRMS